MTITRRGWFGACLTAFFGACLRTQPVIEWTVTADGTYAALNRATFSFWRKKPIFAFIHDPQEFARRAESLSRGH